MIPQHDGQMKLLTILSYFQAFYQDSMSNYPYVSKVRRDRMKKLWIGIIMLKIIVLIRCFMETT